MPDSTLFKMLLVAFLAFVVVVCFLFGVVAIGLLVQIFNGVPI